MGFGGSSPTTATQMMAQTPTPAIAKQAELKTAEATAANKARFQGVGQTWMRPFYGSATSPTALSNQTNTSGKATLGS